MVTSDDIYEVLAQVSEASGAAKGEVLRQNDSQMLRNVLKIALNPFLTYGLNVTPIINQNGCSHFEDVGAFELLEKLAARELSGGAARDEVDHAFNMMSPNSSRLLAMIINKDLRCGIGASTVNKVFKGLVPTFSCMLAAKYDEKSIKKWPVRIEPKLDGVRVLAFVDGHKATFYSRSGKEYTTFDHLSYALVKAFKRAQLSEAYVFDGEVLSGEFNKTVSEVRRKDEQATDAEFHIFDLMPLSQFASLGTTSKQVDRRRHLKAWFENVDEADPLNLIPQYIASSHDEVLVFYSQFRSRGLEGVIVKDPDAPYHFKRNKAWMKIKDCQSVDIRVVGVFEGTGKYEGMLGGLIVDHSGVQVNVGGGFSDQQRKEFWQLRDEVIGRLAEVEFHEETADKSLRHPRFIRLRDYEGSKY